jgi:hypothetical protein
MSLHLIWKAKLGTSFVKLGLTVWASNPQLQPLAGQRAAAFGTLQTTTVADTPVVPPALKLRVL